MRAFLMRLCCIVEDYIRCWVCNNRWCEDHWRNRDHHLAPHKNGIRYVCGDKMVFIGRPTPVRRYNLKYMCEYSEYPTPNKETNSEM